MADTERKSLYISIPIAVKWKISKKTLLAEMQPHHPNWNIIGTMMDIPEMSGLEYRLSIGRNLQLPDNIVFVWLNVLYNQEIHLGFQGQLSVGRSNYEFNECFDEKAAAGKQICTKAELFDPERNFMVNDELIITFEGTAHSINPKVNIGDASEFRDSMGERLMKRVDKDFTICASDGEEFKIHKLIFAVQSSVLDSMVNSDTKEAAENKVTIIDFKGDVIKNVIEYFYDCLDEEKLTVEIAAELLRFADKYIILQMKDSIENFLCKKLLSSNVCQILNAAIYGNSQKMKKFCFDFIILCMRQNISINGFDILDKNVAIEILKEAMCPSVPYQNK